MKGSSNCGRWPLVPRVDDTLSIFHSPVKDKLLLLKEKEVGPSERFLSLKRVFMLRVTAL